MCPLSHRRIHNDHVCVVQEFCFPHCFMANRLERREPAGLCVAASFAQALLPNSSGSFLLKSCNTVPSENSHTEPGRKQLDSKKVT